MTFLSSLPLIFKRLRSGLSLNVLLVLSVAFAVGMMISVPVFANAVCLATIRKEISDERDVTVNLAFPVLVVTRPSNERPMTLAEALRYRDIIGRVLRDQIGLPPRLTRTQVESPLYLLVPPQDDERYTGANLGTIRVAYVQGMEDHVRTVVGEPYGQASDPGVVAVWVERTFADQMGWQVGELYDLEDAHTDALGPIRARIAGLWEALDPADDYWSGDPAKQYREKLLTTAELYEAALSPRIVSGCERALWWYVLDERHMNLSRATHYLDGLEEVTKQAEEALPEPRVSAPVDMLDRAGQLKFSLLLILFGFSLPLVSILIYFTASLSSMLTRFQARETAMFISRGLSRWQVLGLAAIDTLIVLIVACPLGVFLGMLLARLLGSLYGFLEFDFGRWLAVRLVDADLRLAALAVLAGVLVRLVPVWRSMPASAVAQERESSRWRAAMGPMARVLGLALVVVTYYAYRKLAQVGSLPLLSMRLKELAADPLPSVAPILYLFAAPLVASELFTYVVGALMVVARFLPWPGVYLGLISLGREGWRYRASVFMLVLSLSAGVFYASLAKSADEWMLDQRRYQAGADLRFAFSERESLVPQMTLDEYDHIEGVIRTMPVGEYSAVPRVGKEIAIPVRLLGIDRLRFPEVAYFRPDYAPLPLGALMNRLGATPDGLLMPAKLADRFQVSQGDRFLLEMETEDGASYTVGFTIVGFLNYFPTMYAKDPLVVANLDYLQTQADGTLPVSYWMRLKPTADTRRVLHEAGQPEWLAKQARDLRFLVNEDRNRLDRVGIMGMLSLCFAVGALLAGLGFLLQSFASLVARAMRFAVLQALGLRQHEATVMMAVELLVTLLYGLVAGTSLGILASRLYVPFFRLAEGQDSPIPPFIPYIDWDMALRMAGLMGALLIILSVAMLLGLLRARPAEVLRTGAHE